MGILSTPAPAVSGDMFDQLAAQRAPASASASPSQGPDIFDLTAANGGQVPTDRQIQASRPGAYQQTKGGAIRNAQDDLQHPFSESTTSILPSALGGQTGALMQRPDETYQQFMARAVEAGKHVTQAQLDQETAQNKKAVLPTLVAAGAMGAGGAATISYGAAAFDTALGALGLGGDAATDMGLSEWVQQMGMKMPTALDNLSGAARAAVKWMVANPVKSYFIYRAVGDGAHGVSKLLHLFASGAE